MPASSVIGVDLGGTKLLAGVVDAGLAVHHRASRSSRGADEAEVLDVLCGAIREVLGASEQPIAAIGLGVPSLVDVERGVAVSTAHLPLEDVPLRDLLSDRFGLPVYLDNDATTSMLAEWRWGAARGASHAVTITLGTGIGSGAVVDGRLLHGAVGAAPEIGHTCIAIDGPACPCGSVGCFETIVSGRALGAEGERVARAMPQSALGQAVAAGRTMTGALVTEIAHDGDAAARDLVTLMGTRFGVGLANVVNVFNPEVIVVGGGLVAAGDLLLGPARAVVAERALRPSRDIVRIVPARFGAEAGMLGAALMAYDGLGQAVEVA